MFNVVLLFLFFCNYRADNSFFAVYDAGLDIPRTYPLVSVTIPIYTVRNELQAWHQPETVMRGWYVKPQCSLRLRPVCHVNEITAKVSTAFLPLTLKECWRSLGGPSSIKPFALKP